MIFTNLALLYLVDLFDKNGSLTDDQIKLIWEAAGIDAGIIAKMEPDKFQDFVIDTVKQAFPGCEVT